MSFDAWMLALHVLVAFVFRDGSLLDPDRGRSPLSTPRTRPCASARFAKVGNAAVGIGMGGTIVLGIWLALSVGGYDLWDGWIIAALVLWLIACRARPWTGAAYLVGPDEGAGAGAAAGQTGPNAELLAVNRTSTGLAHAHPGVRRRRC